MNTETTVESAATADAIEQAKQESDAKPARAPITWSKDGVRGVFDALKWLVGARSDDETRYFKNGVLIEEDGIMVATDGRRLHKLDGDSMPRFAPGYYTVEETAKIVVLTPKDGVQFPAWRKVMPKGKPRATLELDCEKNKPIEKDMTLGRLAVEVGLQLNVKESSKGGYVNLAFLRPLLGREWRASFWGNDKAMQFESGEEKGIRYTAVIMPACRY